MKRRFFECALLLGIVMSVMFLAQTPDGIGHNEIDPETEEAHEPPGHTHDPSTNVDPNTGEPVTTGGEDPRGNHYSGICGNTEDGYQHAWGFRYGGGTYSTSTTGPDNDTQNVWYIRVDAVASTGSRDASITVTPSIYLTHFHKKEDSWQGSAEGSASFSGVCYHTGLLCIEHSRSGDSWTATGFLDLTVKDAEIEEQETREYGGGFESNGASLTANSKHSYTTKYKDLHARGYRFIIELKGSFFDKYPKLQDKDASGSGQLTGGEVQSGTAAAAYRFTEWKKCYCGESKTPKWHMIP